MAVSARSQMVALALAGAAALAMPLVLLMPGKTARAPAPTAAPVSVIASTAPPLAWVYTRQLFGTIAAAESDAAPGDAPSLIGVVGRLGDDAVALVRTADGATRALKIGDSVDGWTLASLAIDAAFFTRGTERVRVPLPAG